VDVGKLYTRAEEAIRRKNFDLAIELLKNQILKYNPNDVKARKLLRATVLEKYKVRGYPSKGDIISKGAVPRTKMFVGKMLKKWDMVVEEAENYLLHDPKNTSVLFGLGEACMENQYVDTAIAVFEQVVASDRTHASSLKKLGEIYHVHKEDLDKAQQYYQRAYKVAPKDIEAEKKAKAIAALKTSTLYSAADSSQGLVKDKKKAKELQDEQKILRTKEDFENAIDIAKRRMADQGETKRDLRKIADLYVKLQNLDSAISYYQKLIVLDPTNFDAKCKISDCKITKIDMRIKQLQSQYKKNPSDANIKQRLLQTQKQRIQIQIEEFDIQVQDQPTNWELWYKLGTSLYKGKRYDDAIGAFQKAVQDPRHKGNALNYMGQAFLRKKEYGLAEEQFNSALASLDPKANEHREVTYNLGITYESSGQRDKAIETYREIYSKDINYKDVKKRLDALKN